MKDWMASDLSGLDLLVIQIDGIRDANWPAPGSVDTRLS
jgi:hypothetical protein